MAKKINKILRKKYTEKKFRKKILSRLFLEDEKKAVLEFYKNEGGFYLPSETEDKKKIKELNRIAKTIKNNSGALGIGKTGALIAVIIIFTLFSVFLKNPLAEKGLEKALTAAFKAESEIDSLSLSLLKGDIRYKALRVTDREDPGRNLFETGRAVIDINMKEALKGKFNAETIELEYLAIDTERQRRGKVLDSDKADKSGKTDSEKSLPSLKAPEINSDTIRKAIEENLNNLSTPSELEDIKKDYETSKSEIEKGIKKTEENLNSLEKTVDDILTVKIKSPLEVDKIKKLTDDIESASVKADSLINDAENTGNKIKSVSKITSKSAELLDKAAEEDFNFLADKLNPAKSFDLNSYIKDYIMKSFAPFLKKYEKAFEIASEHKKKSSDKKAEAVKRGRIISFPVIGNRPEFLIKNTSGSFIDGEKQYSLKINSITNNQDLIGKPTGFSLSYSKEGDIISAEGYFDNRDDREKNSFIKLSLPSINFSFDDFLPGIKYAEGRYELVSEASIERDKSITGNAEIITSDYKTEGTDDIAGKAVSAVLSRNTPVEVALSFKVGKDKQEIKIKSNLDSLLKDTFSPSEITNDQKDLIRSEIEKYFKDSVLENKRISGEITSLQGDLDSVKNRIEKEKESLKDKLASETSADKIKLPSADKIKLPKKIW